MSMVMSGRYTMRATDVKYIVRVCYGRTWFVRDLCVRLRDARSIARALKNHHSPVDIRRLRDFEPIWYWEA